MKTILIILTINLLTASCGGPGYGIDVSHHNGKINWSKVPKVQYVYIKATEGATHHDELYARNIKGARKAGLLVGSYHYFRTTSSAHAQFENFKAHVDKNKQDLIPMVDLEECKNWTRSQYQDSLRVFMKLVEDYYGKTPMLYSVESFYGKYCAPDFNDYKLMLGKYGTKKAPTIIGRGHYTIWQYSEEGKVRGFPSSVDLSKFHNDCSIKDILLN